VALALALALPAGAYLPPATAILKRVAQRRDELKLSSLEARGTITFTGEMAERARSAGLPASGAEASSPAVFSLMVPGRCRIELAPEGAPPAQRPSASVRPGATAARRGLDGVPAARALVEGVCALLGERGGGEPERGIAQRLADRGVDLREVALGRVEGRVAWVIGGRQQDPVPQAWIDKASFQPVRLVASLAGARRDVRLVGFGSSPGGALFQ
jgi:hypothetical protein